MPRRARRVEPQLDRQPDPEQPRAARGRVEEGIRRYRSLRPAIRQRTRTFAVALVLDAVVTGLLLGRGDGTHGWRLVLGSLVLAGAGLATLLAVAPTRALAVWGILVQALCAVAFAVALPFAMHATWLAALGHTERATVTRVADDGRDTTYALTTESGVRVPIGELSQHDIGTLRVGDSTRVRTDPLHLFKAEGATVRTQAGYLLWDAIVVLAIAGGYLNASRGPLWRYAATRSPTASGTG